MSRSRLPPALLDTLRARASTSLLGASCKQSSARLYALVRLKRSAHAAALRANPVDPEFTQAEREFYERGLDKSKGKEVLRFGEAFSRDLTPLEQRVMALKNATINEESMLETSGFTEEELLDVYEDLLAIPATVDAGTQKAVTEPKIDHEAIVRAIIERVLPSSDEFGDEAAPSLAARLRSIRADSHPELDHNPQDPSSQNALQSVPEYLALISHLEEVAASIESARASASALDVAHAATESSNVDEASKLLPPPPVPVALMTAQEWSSVARVCVNKGDAASAVRVFDLMKRVGTTPTEDTLDYVLNHYANTGDIQCVDNIVGKHLTTSPTENQRRIHIKAYLKSESSAAFPTRSLELLHSYELRGLPAPQKSYTSLITHLFSVQDTVAYAHAWDLFSHMRYVAHPTPDALLYTLMIRACASSSLTSRGDPERAMDLFTEMTVDQGMAPTAGAYTATILALARSGRREYVHEAFRLAKEMMDAHRDARGNSAFTPNRNLFIALLEGAKRIGDLGRARWILAEMVKEYNSRPSTSIDVIDEEVMLHVFHTYSSYRPPFKRSETLVVDEQPASVVAEGVSAEAELSSTSTAPDEPRLTEVAETEQSRLPQVPPQTSSEIVGEAKILFRRIVEDSRNASKLNGGRGVFHKVRLTPKLINSYLAVHASHSLFNQYAELFKTLHAEVGIPRNAWTYVDALERCSITGMKRKQERAMALQLADEIWAEWKAIENEWKAQSDTYAAQTMTARLLERMYAARIRILALTRQVDRAMEVVKSFVHMYPPTAIREPMPKLSARSTRTSLVAARPLVRLTSEVDIPDDHVPPLLSFPEVEVLHSRLVKADRKDDIKYLKWMCKSYEGALRIRRDRAMQARPISNPQPIHSSVELKN